MSFATKSAFAAILGLAVAFPAFAFAATTTPARTACINAARTAQINANTASFNVSKAATAAAYLTYSQAVTASKSQPTNAGRLNAIAAAKTAYKAKIAQNTATYKAALVTHTNTYKTALRNCPK